MKTLPTIAVAILCASSALAAGPATVSDPVVETFETAHNWSGSYLGLGIDSSDMSAIMNTGVLFTNNASAVSVIGGRNWQGEGPFVRGIEFEFTSNRSVSNQCSFGVISCDGTYGPTALLRGRLGYASGSTLLFASAGIAASANALGTNTVANGVISTTNYRIGYTLSVGIEHALPSGWNMRTEFEHTDFGVARYVVDAVPAGFDFRTTSSTLRLAILRRF